MVVEVSIVMTKLKKISLASLKVITVIFTIGLIPVLLYLIFAKKVTSGEWLGFFGTYFGSAISIGFAYINTKQQLKKTYEKEIVDNLRDLLRSFELYLKSLGNLYDVRNDVLYDQIFLRDIYNYKEIGDKILYVLNRADNLLVEFDSIMNQLKENETEQINPAFKAWNDRYRSFHYIKYVCNNLSPEKVEEPGFKAYFVKNIERLDLTEFIAQTEEFKLAIAKVYKKRLKKVIS